MKTKIKSTVSVIAGVALTLGLILTSTSCKKDVKGCKDPNSTNFSSSATTDDGSCTYNGRVVFWYKKATADSMVAHGVSSLSFNLNNAVIGSSGTAVYFTGAPDCASNGAAAKTMDLGTDKSKVYPYTVTAYVGTTSIGVIASGNITLNSANSCLQFEIAW